MSPPRRPARARAALCLLLALAACAKSDAQWADELADRDPFVRALAALALAEQAPARGPQALPVLLETVDRVELGLGPLAEAAVRRVAPFAVGPLIAELASGEVPTIERKRAVVEALVACGEGAVAPLLAAVEGPAAGAAGELGVVLVRIGEPSVPHLVALLARARDPSLADYAAFLLGELGPRARAAVPTLRAALEHPAPAVRATAAEALRRIEGGG